MLTKRIFDLVFVIPGLLLLSPAFLLISFFIKVDSKGPVFFRQERVGKAGKIFKIYKFRTMVVNAELLGAKVTVANDSRITQSGAFLRKYKLDELPQLLNVFIGDMSLVGPRPEVTEYVDYWPDDIRKIVLSVPPGITDFASIEFRNENEILKSASDPLEMYVKEIIPIKLNYYTRYVREQNIFLDFWLILRTFSAIIR